MDADGTGRGDEEEDDISEDEDDANYQGLRN